MLFKTNENQEIFIFIKTKHFFYSSEILELKLKLNSEAKGEEKFVSFLNLPTLLFFLFKEINNRKLKQNLHRSLFHSCLSFNYK
jgi:hypothetical protein